MLRFFGSLIDTKQGFSIVNNTNHSIYDFLGRNPHRARRFATAMTSFKTESNNVAPFLIDNYAWDAIGTGMVIDLGGSKGHISVKRELISRVRIDS